MPFASRPERQPDVVRDGIEVWVDEQKGSLFIVARKDDPKTNKWRLVETHTGPHGCDIRFERIQT
jgi:hypothetical protein